MRFSKYAKKIDALVERVNPNEHEILDAVLDLTVNKKMAKAGLEMLCDGLMKKYPQHTDTLKAIRDNADIIVKAGLKVMGMKKWIRKLKC